MENIISEYLVGLFLSLFILLKGLSAFCFMGRGNQGISGYTNSFCFKLQYI